MSSDLTATSSLDISTLTYSEINLYDASTFDAQQLRGADLDGNPVLYLLTAKQVAQLKHGGNTVLQDLSAAQITQLSSTAIGKLTYAQLNRVVAGSGTATVPSVLAQAHVNALKIKGFKVFALSSYKGTSYVL